jgi:hypothetical protein
VLASQEALFPGSAGLYGRRASARRGVGAPRRELWRIPDAVALQGCRGSFLPAEPIVAHRSLIAEAADPIDIEPLGQRPPGALAFSGGLGKARIEIGFERAVNKQGSVLRCADPASLSS